MTSRAWSDAHVSKRCGVPRTGQEGTKTVIRVIAREADAERCWADARLGGGVAGYGDVT